MCHNSKNKCYLLASRQCLQSGTWKRQNEHFTVCSWLVLLECTSWWIPTSKCFHMVHVSMNSLFCDIVLLLLQLLCLCLCHGFLINESAISQPVFYHYWYTVYGRYVLGGWILQAETTHSTIYTQSVLRWASLAHRFFFSGVLPSFLRSSQWE